MPKPLLSIILPCYNEAENIALIYASLKKTCAEIDSEILFINDGSTDTTKAKIEALIVNDKNIRLISFVRNFGHQQALRAGYREAIGSFMVTLDADLQQPPEYIPLMLAKAQEGYEVVQMIRDNSQNGMTKNLFSKAFYKIFNQMSEFPMVSEGPDFRLITRFVCDIINKLPERNLMIRAIIPHLGFKIFSLPYLSSARLHGHPAYTFKKSFHLGTDALFNFSTIPLKIGFKLGFLISSLAFIYGLFNVFAKFFTHWNVPGYTDVIASVLFLSGLIILYLGVLGRYLLIVVEHLRQRPEYVISQNHENKY